MENHMTARELQAFLHANIPATAALSLSVVDITPDSLILSVPHAPNRNHKNTVFGGSIALAATVGGWAMVHSRFPEAAGNIVIQQGETRYLHPANGDLTVITRAAAEEDWRKMKEMFEQRGKGKIVLETEIFSDGVKAAVFSGKFVALKG